MFRFAVRIREVKPRGAIRGVKPRSPRINSARVINQITAIN